MVVHFRLAAKIVNIEAVFLYKDVETEINMGDH